MQNIAVYQILFCYFYAIDMGAVCTALINSSISPIFIADNVTVVAADSRVLNTNIITFQTFEAVFRDVPVAMVLTDPTRKIMMCNPGLARTFGYEPEEVLGKDTAMFYESLEE